MADDYLGRFPTPLVLHVVQLLLSFRFLFICSENKCELAGFDCGSQQYVSKGVKQLVNIF